MNFETIFGDAMDDTYGWLKHGDLRCAAASMSIIFRIMCSMGWEREEEYEACQTLSTELSRLYFGRMEELRLMLPSQRFM